MSRKNLLFIFIAFATSSCGNSNAPSYSRDTNNEKVENVSDIEMFRATDCATCHKLNETFVGPSFSDIAKRYPNAADTTIARLVLSVQKGSTGKWTAVAPMTPHPTMSNSDLEKMVKYILEVKK